jgi:ligand-binding sensor domain-containing protein
LALDRSLSLEQLHHTAWSTRDGAPAEVESLAQTDDGTLWLGSPTGLFQFDGLQFERFQPPSGQGGSTGSVSMLLAQPGNGLWIGYRFGGIGWWNHGQLRHFGRADGLPSGTVTAVTIDTQGRPWVGTTTGTPASTACAGAHWPRPWAIPPAPPMRCTSTAPAPSGPWPRTARGG